MAPCSVPITVGASTVTVHALHCLKLKNSLQEHKAVANQKSCAVSYPAQVSLVWRSELKSVGML